MKNVSKTRLKLIVGIMTVSVLLSGCSSNRQLHERLIVQGVGVDKENDEYVLTLNIFDTESPGEKNDSAENSKDTPGLIKCKGKSVLDAFTNITNSTGKEPMYSQNLILIISEEIARAGVNSFIDFFVRHYEARPGINVFVVKGHASDALKCKLNGKQIDSKTISSLAKSSHLNMNVIDTNLVKFVSHMQSNTSEAAAVLLNIDVNGELSAKGSAIFHGDKLVDFLDENETKGTLLISGVNKGGTEVIKIDNIGAVTYSITSSQSTTNVDVVNDVPVFDIKTAVETNIYEIDRDLKSPLPENSFSILENELKYKLENLIKSSLQKSIVTNHCDIFDFGRQLMKTNPSYFCSVSNNFGNVIAKSLFNVSVNVKINKTGQEFNPVHDFLKTPMAPRAPRALFLRFAAFFRVF